MVLIRGTTPTIKFTFSQISPTDIREAYLVFKKQGLSVLEKSLGYADIEENCISFTLTQQETLAFTAGTRLTCCLDWLTADGTRGRSKTAEFCVDNSGKDEVI